MQLPMRRVDIVAPRALAGPTLRAIHRTGLLHVAPYEAPAGLGPATFLVPPGGGEPTAFDEAAERAAELAARLGPARPEPTVVAALWELDDTTLPARAAALARRPLSDSRRCVRIANTMRPTNSATPSTNPARPSSPATRSQNDSVSRACASLRMTGPEVT